MVVLTSFPDRECASAALDLAVREPEDCGPLVFDRLAAFRDRGAVDALVESLRSKEERRREAAARALGRIPDGRVAAALARQLKAETSESVAAALVAALGDQGDPAQAEVLLQAARAVRSVHDAAVRALARLGFGLPEVRRFLLDLLDSKSWEDRVLAVDAVGAFGDPGLAPRVLPALEGDAWPLRLAAVEALRRLRPRCAVQPLIARIGKEESARVRTAVARALFELTGSNLYDDAALWNRWWEEHGATFEVPREVPKLPGDVQGGSVGSFFGIPVQTDRVAFVLDQSGSMDIRDAYGRAGGKDAGGATRFDRAVRETLAAVGRLTPKAMVNVVLFESSVHPWRERLVPLTPATRAELEKHLRKQKPMGGTDLYDGLEKALLDRDADTVMLLSDGAPNAGKFTEPGDILAAVRRLNQTRRIAIHCVSLGTDSAFLRRLAEENSGTYVRR